jgi:hypothetical protein
MMHDVDSSPWWSQSTHSEGEPMDVIEPLAAYSPTYITVPAPFLEVTNSLLWWLRNRLQHQPAYSTGDNFSVQLNTASRLGNALHVGGVVGQQYENDFRPLTSLPAAVVVNLKPLTPEMTQLQIANTQSSHALGSFVDELVADVRTYWQVGSAGEPTDLRNYSKGNWHFMDKAA